MCCVKFIQNCKYSLTNWYRGRPLVGDNHRRKLSRVTNPQISDSVFSLSSFSARNECYSTFLTLLEKPIIILQLQSLYVFYPVLLLRNFTRFSCARSSSKPSKVSFVVRSSARTRGSIGTAWKKLRTKIHKFTFFRVKPLNIYEVWIAHLIDPNASFTPNQ